MPGDRTGRPLIGAMGSMTPSHRKKSTLNTTAGEPYANIV